MSEALAEDGSYNAVGFTYGSDYYDPSEPTEEEEPSKQRGERETAWMVVLGGYGLCGCEVFTIVPPDNYSTTGAERTLLVFLLRLEQS